MGIGQEYSTPENYLEAGERDLHISNTRFRGKAIDFWMFAPPYARPKPVIVCGVCKTEIPKGERHCPHCYGEEES